MVASLKLRDFVKICVGITVITAFMEVSQSRVQAGNPVLLDPVPPPLSVPTALYFKSHPEAWAQFLAQRPRRPAGMPLATAPLVSPPAKVPWSTVTTAPSGGLCNPILLTDGTVMVAVCNTPFWYKLTPDITNSYKNGTWSQIASLPVIGGIQYAPLYHASAVLPDGRVIIVGGEYNGSGTEVWTNLGAIYDPVANSWTPVSAPNASGWSHIGDAEGVVLANGTFMLGSCCGSPDVDALFNASTLGWTSTGSPNAGANYQDEQGYELLPNGHVLTLDIWTNVSSGGNATNAEQYNPATGSWSSAGNTPVSLPDPHACGTFEIGPAVLRGTQTLVAFGGNSGCVAGATADPTAIYSMKTGKWSAGPNIPADCGSGGTTSCTLADAPAALLPDGNILFAASAGFAQSPTHFFEFTAVNTINKVSDPVFNASSSSSYYYNFVVLPNGHIFMTDFSNIAELYTPTGTAIASLAPVISTGPATVVPGQTYTITGKQLNGRSQGAFYGDDVQTATNYPIVQIINATTGHVFYGRTHNFSSMSIATNAISSTLVTIPGNIEAGVSNLFVIANGIASTPKSIIVQ
jgi:hypothetical protein